MVGGGILLAVSARTSKARGNATTHTANAKPMYRYIADVILIKIPNFHTLVPTEYVFVDADLNSGAHAHSRHGDVIWKSMTSYYSCFVHLSKSVSVGQQRTTLTDARTTWTRTSHNNKHPDVSWSGAQLRV